MQRRQLLALGIVAAAAGIGGIASRQAFAADLDRAKARLGWAALCLIVALAGWNMPCKAAARLVS